MTLIIVLNAVFAAFVVIGIIGLHLYAIAKDHAEHTGTPLVPAASDGSASHRRALAPRGTVASRGARSAPFRFEAAPRAAGPRPET
jgi:hypothetical protein